MKIERSFEHSDRYRFDFNLCSARNGWAQVDTGQDASYFGTWAHPEQLQVVSYCEGDITVVTADNPQEFREELESIRHWNARMGYSFGVDAYGIESRFEKLGLGHMLH